MTCSEPNRGLASRAQSEALVLTIGLVAVVAKWIVRQKAPRRGVVCAADVLMAKRYRGSLLAFAIALTTKHDAKSRH